MKTPAKDIVLIAVALIAILGCGYGLGKRFAPEAVEIDPSPAEVEVGDFADMTMSRLRATLGLTDEQETAIWRDIEAASNQVTHTRTRALFDYHLHIRQLHDTIRPKLGPQQQEELDKSRASLQKVIELRFRALLDETESSTGSGRETREESP